MKDKGFLPVIDEHAKLLILGSMPGVESLKVQQYYGNPRNAFWPIIERLCGIAVNEQYDKRLEQLKKHKIAVWDVIASCHRKGSLDSNIDSTSVEANDFEGLLEEYPNIQAIVFNGKTVEGFFKKFVINKGILIPKKIQLHTLPSTSPANARLTKEQKLEQWKLILKYT